MFTRTHLCILAAFTVASGILAAGPASAVDGPATSEFVKTWGGSTAVGACNFLLSGPSLDPGSTPYRLVGTATIVSSRVVASTSLRCRLRLTTGTKPQVGNALVRALPLNDSAVAGDVNVSSFGPFEICTYIDAVFDDTSHLNTTNTETCRPLTRIL
jgi:hypothetical protein